MAFTGLHVSCCYIGCTGLAANFASSEGPSVIAVPRQTIWSETLTSAGTTTQSAPGFDPRYGEAVFFISASDDSFVATGNPPVASGLSGTGSSGRKLVRGGTETPVVANPGDRVAWVAA